MMIENLINYRDKVKAIVRKNTSDEFIVKEVFSGAYRKLKITENDIVVDFGLNIGMFTILACQKKAEKVYGYEAEHENFIQAQKNIKLNNIPLNQYEIHNLAVVGNDDKQRIFSINKKKNKAAHSLVVKRGRDSIFVNCININNILETVKPTIVKMDIEGAEYECIKSIKDFKNIKQLIFEFHHAHLLDTKTRKKYSELLYIVNKNFPNVEASLDPKGAWVTLVYCSK